MDDPSPTNKFVSGAGGKFFVMHKDYCNRTYFICKADQATQKVFVIRNL
jgi:hypothetical protein